MKHRCYALVIGINNYTNNTTLTNAVNDALGVAQTFRELRYEVECLEIPLSINLQKPMIAFV